MAMFDDVQWLMSHIQNSYATSDDTGFSEIVLQEKWPAEKLVDFPYLFRDDSITALDYDETESSSLDIHTDHFGGHRSRSYTEHRLNKLKEEKSRQAKITRIVWPSNLAPISDADAAELFTPRPVPIVSMPSNKPSMLSILLEESSINENLYQEYIKWDASSSKSGLSKRFRIFVYHSISDEAPMYPVEVAIRSDALVSDLIGLTCYLYTRDNKKPNLEYKDVTNYSLFCAEDNGSVDRDLPPLTHTFQIKKYDFGVLALTPATAVTASQFSTVNVKVHISGGVFSLIECENKHITLREILNRTIAKRREMAKVIEAGVQYHLERAQDEPGVVLNLDYSLNDIETTELYAVRDNKVSCSGITMSVSGGGSSVGPFRAPQPMPVSYSCNRIVCCNIKTATPLASVTGKKLTPGSARDKHSSTNGRKKATLDNVASKVMVETPGRCEILLTCQGDQRLKDYVLECTESVAHELVEAVKRIRTEDGSSIGEEEKPKRRYSFAGLKKKSRSSYVARIN